MAKSAKKRRPYLRNGIIGFVCGAGFPLPAAWLLKVTEEGMVEHDLLAAIVDGLVWPGSILERYLADTWILRGENFVGGFVLFLTYFGVIGCLVALVLTLVWRWLRRVRRHRSDGA